MVKKKKMWCRWCQRFYDKKRKVAQMDILTGKLKLVEANRNKCPVCKQELEEKVLGR